MVLTCFRPLCRGVFRSQKDFQNHYFHAQVTPSDEAFVWQIMNYYYDQWDKCIGIEDMSQSDDASSVKKKGGAQKGFTDTAGKTNDKYKENKERVRMMRIDNASTARQWSIRLQKAVRRKEEERIAECNEKARKEQEDFLAASAAAEAEREVVTVSHTPLTDELGNMGGMLFQDSSSDEEDVDSYGAPETIAV